MNKYRTYTCNTIREKNVCEHIKLAGWIQTIRDLGGVIFIDLRDQYGITQIVASGNEELVDFATRIPIESTISVEGTVRLRSEDTINEKLDTGLVELFAEKIEILGKRTKQLPFEIESSRDVREDLRLQYRFLDLRNEKLKNNLILAPMAGVTDLPFRKICKEFGPGLVCTEMVSSKAIYHDDTKTKLLMNTDGEKRPISMQIFGSDEETMGYAAKYVSKIADIVDINMGCPAPKVVKNGDGSKLLLDLNKAEEIIKSVVKNSTKPVTLKFRKGWNDENIVACELAKIAEKCGVSAITIHGRTREEYYSGKADLDIIKTVKESVKIPVIGNGDIIDEESALRMFEYTGVDGIMIGRGAIGNPWIFEQIKYYLENNKKMSAPTNKEKYEIIKEHLELNLKEKGNVVGINEMRKHISAYTKNMPEASRFRDEINHITDVNILMSKIQEFFIDIFDKK